jgi:hypothetical protein
MGFFRKRPCEARQFSGLSNGEAEDIAQWAGGRIGNNCIEIEKPSHVAVAVLGDWVVKDADGEVCTYKPDTFAKTFELDPTDLVKQALAEYEAAQVHQSQAVQSMNQHALIYADAFDAGAQGNVPYVISYRAETLRREAEFSRAGARVMQAAADLVRALRDSGFGAPVKAEVTP